MRRKVLPQNLNRPDESNRKCLINQCPTRAGWATRQDATRRARVWAPTSCTSALALLHMLCARIIRRTSGRRMKSIIRMCWSTCRLNLELWGWGAKEVSLVPGPSRTTPCWGRDCSKAGEPLIKKRWWQDGTDLPGLALGSLGMCVCLCVCVCVCVFVFLLMCVFPWRLHNGESSFSTIVGRKKSVAGLKRRALNGRVKSFDKCHLFRALDQQA